MHCNFCEHDRLKQVYVPVGSKISLTICICQNCGLVQSTSQKLSTREENVVAKKEKSITRLSCDADYSDVRVGKGQMADSAISMLDAHLGTEDIKDVLDICSARGHFAYKAIDYFQLDSIDCIDPDAYMTTSYADDPRIHLTIGKYDALKTHKNYDLIYSCHTLEHYRDPAKNIRFMIDHLKPGKYLLLDVPNLETIKSSYNLDDFFYDHHKFYFSRIILQYFLISCGMELIAQNDGSSSITFLMRKSHSRMPFLVDRTNVSLHEDLIDSYQINLKNNRRKLPAATQQIQKIARNKVNVLFGCGRALDALIVYGKLPIDSFDILIDNFLSNATQKLYGKPLYRSSILDHKRVDNIFLMTRSSTDSLLADLSRKYPKTRIIHINDLLDKVL